MRIKRLIAVAAASVGLGVSSQALAGTAYYSGALTANDPTFHHPNASTAGTGVQYYDVSAFTVDTTGAYVIEMTSPNTTGTPSNALDTFLAVYANTFNPASPGAGIGFNDDFTGTLTVLPGSSGFPVTSTATGFTGAQPSSRLTVNLTAGTQYYLVNTSFRDTSFVGTGTTAQAVGNYYVGINGPGNITIPAPGALALLGLAGMVGSRRRRA